MTFAFPTVLVLLALPVLLLVWEWRRRGTTLAMPFDHAGAKRGRWLEGIVKIANLGPPLLLAVAIVLLAGPQRNWSTLLADRFSRILDDAARRITILPRQSGGDFLQLMSLADVVLDTPHFSGGNTSYEAFALGKVIVTLPGEFMRSRVTAGLYLLMAIDEPVAHSPENYVEIALKLGLDPALRANIENQIKAAADTIFETNSAIRSHEQFFLEALAIAPH